METLPKFLKVSRAVEEMTHNTSLPCPLKINEIVKVHKDQSSSLSNVTQSEFSNNYIRVIRRDANGEWSKIEVRGKRCFIDLKARQPEPRKRIKITD